MKKIILGILAITLLAGCDININTGKNSDAKEDAKENVACEPSNDSVQDFVLSNMEHLTTVEKNITLNGKNHNLQFVYSYGLIRQFSENQNFWVNVIYLTVLMDGKTTSSALTNAVIYAENFYDEDPLRNNLSTKEKYTKEEALNYLNEQELVVTTISNSNDKQFLVIELESNDNDSVYILNDERRLLYDHSIAANYSISNSNGTYIISPDTQDMSKFIVNKNNSITIYDETTKIDLSIASDGEIINAEEKWYSDLGYSSDYSGM